VAEESKTADPPGECPEPDRIEMHWISPSGEILGPSIASGIEAEPAWVALYAGQWVRIFPRGVNYGQPN
jgi:hypothetical protein